MEPSNEQHVVVSHMMKHKKTQAHSKTTPHFMIPTSIAKELADMMQVWTINESAGPAAETIT